MTVQVPTTEAGKRVSHDETPEGGDVSSFLAGRHVLLTGASGFVGKALLERLLRCCPHVASVQLLLRPKRGADAQQRLQQLLADAALDRVRAEQPAALAKVHALPGDVGEERLGLSDADRLRVCACVSVVFHSAATVRFNEPLRDAVRTNVRGTQQVLQLCREMSQLKVLVYVSTAYVNCIKKDITIMEKVYPLPYDPYSVLKACEIKDDVLLDTLEKKWTARYPNTYIFSKAAAENLVADATDIPAVIVRPSIVSGALEEPFPGWVDAPCGITGLVSGYMQGLLRGMIVDGRKRANIVPIDYVVKVILAAAWHVANHSSNDVIVFNCTSHPSNTITWGKFIEHVIEFSRQHPPQCTVWTPNMTSHSNKVMKDIHFTVVTKWLAIFAELMCRLQGRPMRILEASRKVQFQADVSQYFLTNEWEFCNKNTLQLMDSHHDATFTDLSKMDWKSYLEQYILGIRRYVFKEEPETLPAAKKQLERITWAYQVGKVLALTLLIHILFSTITGYLF